MILVAVKKWTRIEVYSDPWLTANIVTFKLIKQNKKAIIKVLLKDKDISVKSTVLHYTTTDNKHNNSVPTFQKENRNFGCHFRVSGNNAKIF